MQKHLAVPLLIVMAGAPGLLAQNHIAISGGQLAGGYGHGGRISFGEGMRRPTHRRAPYFYGTPYFNSDYEPTEAEYPAAPPESQKVPVIQTKPETLPDPLLLELHGKQWVRVTNFGEPFEPAAAREPAVQSQLPKKMRAAVLIYRDGHSEEVSSYSIIGKVMYTKSDYWTSGAWTKTIKIADLDVAATLKQNQQRGVKFELPAGPDEVVIRP